MMLVLHAVARQRGATEIRLRVAPQNRPARALYDSCGYRPVGMERDEVLMMLDLTVAPELRYDLHERATRDGAGAAAAGPGAAGPGAGDTDDDVPVSPQAAERSATQS
jgi:hypothetical protein